MYDRHRALVSHPAYLPPGPRARPGVGALKECGRGLHGLARGRLRGADSRARHVIRNAGSTVPRTRLITPCRSTQHLMGTEEVSSSTTGCGMLLHRRSAVCSRPGDGHRREGRPGRQGPSPNLAGGVRQSIARIKASPFIPTPRRARLRPGPGRRPPGEDDARRGWLTSPPGIGTARPPGLLYLATFRSLRVPG